MKKVYKIVIGFVLFIFIVLVSIPLLFQDKIIQLVKETVNNNVNAKVDFADGSLSLIRNFPNASVKLSDISVINKSPFEGDTLLYAKDITLTLKLTELFKNTSEQLNIKSFNIHKAFVNVVVNKEGKANYDIAKKTSPEQQQDSPEATTSSFGLSIDQYGIFDTNIVYHDAKGKMKVELSNFTHEGKGDFSQSNSELNTKTSTILSFGKDGISYIANQKLALEAILGMDLVNKKFNFLKNKLEINNLPLVFNGFVKINDNNQQVALNFSTPSSDFKNFLGLVPEIYAKNISNVKTSGNFSVSGKIDGFIDDKRIPKFDIAMKASNASFKYPDLPKSVRNINIDTQVKNTTGSLQSTFIDINNISFKIDEDTFSGKGTLHNVTTNPLVRANLKGTLNLANIHKAYPIELQNELRGILKANLNTHFDVNALKKNIIQRIKKEGSIELSDFVYASKDVVNPIHIKSTKVQFDPQIVSLKKFEASTGKSDINATGNLQNLLGFLLADKTLQGTFNVASNNFYVSDFMQKNDSSDEKKTPKKEPKQETNPQESLKIPAFLDCKILADAKTVHYDNLMLKDVKGTLWLKDEKATLKNMSAGVFNGRISLNGEVNTQPKTPTFNMNLGINSFDIAQSFVSMDLLQSLSPVASAFDGKLNSDVNLSGKLNADFTPNLATITGKALAELLGTKVNPKKTKALSLLDNKLSFIDLNKLDLSNIKTHLAFKEGKVEVSPFNLKYQDIGIQVGGSHGFDQNMNYNVTFDVPAKYLGNEVKGLLSKLNGANDDTTVPVTASISGNMSSPNVSTDLSSSVTKLTQKLVQQQKDNLVNNTLNNLLGGDKKESKDKKGSETEKTVNKVKDVLGGLFGKKKKKEDEKK